MNRTQVVMFAWGNPSRGDDAVGPWFADKFRAGAHDMFFLVEDFQLQVEHLLDCQRGDLLLFVDARCDNSPTYQFEEVQPSAGVSHTSHALAPAELLGYYHRLFHHPPPPAFLLTVPGSSFDLGQSMTATTLACCQEAATLVEVLLRAPRPKLWRRHVTA